jgi:hypothetical protein
MVESDRKSAEGADASPGGVADLIRDAGLVEHLERTLGVPAPVVAAGIEIQLLPRSAPEMPKPSRWRNYHGPFKEGFDFP